MRKRLIAGILTAVMVVSSLQLQTVSVTAKEMYQETEEASLAMEDADTETQKQGEETAVTDAETKSGMESETGTQGESAAEGTDSEVESGKQEDETDNEDSKENETDDETEGESQENGEESAATEDEEAEPEIAQEETDVEDSEEENIEEPSEDETEIEAVGAEMTLETSDSDIASGQYTENGSNVSWVIDANGKLMVEGTGDFAGSSRMWNNPGAPWYSKAESIISAEIKVTGMTNASFMFCGCTNLTSVDLDGFDTSNVTNMAYMLYGCSSLTSLDLSNFDTSKVNNMRWMFSGCKNLASLDLSGFGTSEVTDMSCMFAGCSGFTSLDLSNFNTSKVKDMDRMFARCENLTSLELSNFDTSNVGGYIHYADGSLNIGSMDGMFYGCKSLTSVDVSNFDTHKVGSMSQMFSECSSLVSIDLSHFDISEASVIDRMFEGCLSLVSVDISGFKTKKNATVNMFNMFSGCSSLTSVNLKDVDTSSARQMQYMFAGCKSLTSVDLSDLDTGNVSDMKYMFYGCENLTSLDLSNFDTSSVSDMADMFSGCSSLTSLNVSNFDTSSVSDMERMFFGCENLISLDLSNFNNSNVTSMFGMFCGCSSLTDLNLSSFNTGSVINMVRMFKDCKSLTTLDLKNFDTSKVIDMGGMFYGCSSLTSLDLSSFDTSSVVGMGGWFGGMFEGCVSLTSLNLSNFDTSKVTSMERMFYGCSGLTGLDLSSFNTSNVTVMRDMFNGCSSLTSLDVSNFDTSNVTDMVAMFYVCTSLTSLDISGFNTSNVNVNSFYWLINGCENLSIIYTPYMLTQTIRLGGVWYNCDGEKITELPQRLGHSIVIMKNQIPYKSTIIATKTKTVYECGDILNTDDLTVYYHNDSGKLEIITEGYSTNANDIDMSKSGKKILRITYNGMTAKVEIIVGKDDGESQEPEEETGFEVGMDCEDNTYTGSAVKPRVYAAYNGKDLVEGIDYTVKYSNNINAGTATATVTGKGNFVKGGSRLTFEIWQREIDETVINGAATNEEEKEILTLASGSKLNPVLYFNNIKLTNKDFVVKDKDNKEITGKKLSDADNNTTIFIEAKEKGNFCGSREVTLNIVDKKRLSKFTVSLDKTKLNTLTYDGSEHYIHDISGALTVTAKDAAKTKMEYGRDYTIVYPRDLINAGAKKFTVVGKGLYTGNVSKSYTIKPAKEASLDVKYDGSSITGNKINTPFTFVSSGITFNDKLSITGIDGEYLYEGADYKVSYSGNKKVGTTAKCTITFLGNYKGHAKQVVGFEIDKADLSGTEVVIADQAYKGKEGIYKSVPYVIEDKGGANVLVKSSNYKTTYYTEDPTNNESAVQIKGKNKVKSGDTVWVKLEAKGKNYSGTKVINYKVREGQDLSKAKITFKDAEGKKVNKMPYTGYKITGRHIKAVVNENLAEDDDDIEVIYVNNINKGKATVIVKGTDSANCKYVGCKTATFNIVARIFSFD